MAKGFVGIPVTHEELVAVCEDMLAAIKDKDSFEGFFNYLMPIPEGSCEIDENSSSRCMWGTRGCAVDHDKEFPEGTYAILEARYRIGNSMGQGGMRMVGEMREI